LDSSSTAPFLQDDFHTIAGFCASSTTLLNVKVFWLLLQVQQQQEKQKNQKRPNENGTWPAPRNEKGPERGSIMPLPGQSSTFRPRNPQPLASVPRMNAVTDPIRKPMSSARGTRIWRQEYITGRHLPHCQFPFLSAHSSYSGASIN